MRQDCRDGGPRKCCAHKRRRKPGGNGSAKRPTSQAGCSALSAPRPLPMKNFSASGRGTGRVLHAKAHLAFAPAGAAKCPFLQHGDTRAATTRAEERRIGAKRTSPPAGRERQGRSAAKALQISCSELDARPANACLAADAGKLSLALALPASAHETRFVRASFPRAQNAREKPMNTDVLPSVSRSISGLFLISPGRLLYLIFPITVHFSPSGRRNDTPTCGMVTEPGL